MLRRFEGAIEGLVRRVGYDARSLCDRIDSVADEDDFTSRLAQDIERSIDGKNIGGVRFTAITKKLKSRGKQSEESAIGADLILAIRMQAGAFDVSKGYLIQAKMNRGELLRIRVREPERLSGQIDDMLSVTDDAYVWAYSDQGIAVARAGSFQSALASELTTEYLPQTFTGFFRYAFHSICGDYRLGAITRKELATFAEEYRARRYLIISGTES